jgi:hypothetical protein
VFCGDLQDSVVFSGDGKEVNCTCGGTAIGAGTYNIKMSITGRKHHKEAPV